MDKKEIERIGGVQRKPSMFFVSQWLRENVITNGKEDAKHTSCSEIRVRELGLDMLQVRSTRTLTYIPTCM
jgi:hypothetical protein